MTTNKKLGNWGEKLAESYLVKKGYHLLDKNYRSGRTEIDLIFQTKNIFVFIEVKTRIKTDESEQENPLTSRQIKTLRQAMIAYCLKNKINLDRARLDLIFILTDKKTKRAALKHYLDIL